MNKDEIKIIKNINSEILSKFDINKCYMNWLHEHSILFERPAPRVVKKLIKKTKLLWIKDEFALFRILANEFIDKEYKCPKCKVGEFIPSRYKKLEKMYETQKCVKVEKPRTLSCSNCSFTFNPLSITPYRNLKLDLRKYMFYQYISEDGKINYPISNISKILEISYNTAKSIKKFIENGRPWSDEEQKKYLNKITEKHWMVYVAEQFCKFHKK